MNAMKKLLKALLCTTALMANAAEAAITSPPLYYDNTAGVIGFYSIADTFTLLAQATTVYSPTTYCFIGDGSSHALSTVHSCKGVNTTGFTLVQWQGLLPAATALTDEIDGVALQTMLNAGLPIVLPASTALISHTLAAPCGFSMTIIGLGPQSTFIKFKAAGADGIDYCVGGQAVLTNNFTLSGVNLMCSAVSACAQMVNANLWVPTNYHIVENIQGTPDVSNWANGLLFTNASRLEIHRVTVSGTYSPTTGSVAGKGLALASANNPMASPQGAFGANIIDVELYGWGTCFEADSTTVNGVEGVVMNRGSCDASNNFFVHTNTHASTYQSPEYHISHTQIHIWKQIINAKGISNFLFDHNSPIYIDTPGPGAGVDLIKLDDVQVAAIDHNQFLPTTPGPITYNSVMKFANTDIGPNNININDNNINTGFGTSTVTTAGIIMPSNARIVDEHNDTWNVFLATGKPEISNASVATSVNFESLADGNPTMGACGGGTPTVGGDGIGGLVQTGTGAPTTCTINLVQTHAVAPNCTAIDGTALTVMNANTTTSAIVFGFAAGATSTFFSYVCSPRQR